MRSYLISLLWLASGLAWGALAPEVIHHRLQVALDPQEGRLQATDRLTLPKVARHFDFLLHDGLAPRLVAPAGRLEAGEPAAAPVPARHYRVILQEPTRHLTLSWGGKLRHPVATAPGEEREGTPGTLSPQGIYLAGSSLWYPTGGDRRLTFELEIDLPEGWRAISQGETIPGGWRETHPQEAIYLVAGPYHRYQEGRAQVWLRNADEPLARRYLKATADHLALYEALIGPYPYAKFALVENFWESGYGMPSFTLLGPRVIRLPFILHSAYPHEILHNWWGNGVYVDARQGNWAEGLTSYLADHLMKERQGQGAAYRRDTLLAYANWAAKGRDRPLARFRGRHGRASQAAGYGRMLMVTHMLRQRLGDATFIEGLQRFYRDNRFRFADFDDLRSAFEAVSGLDLKAFFDQWTRRAGAPRLHLEEVTVTTAKGRWRLEFTLAQTQKEPPFELRVPIFVQTANATEAQGHWVVLSQRRQRFTLILDDRPLRLRVDPRYDLFRHLAEDEIPPTVAGILGAPRAWLVLPSAAPPAEAAAWQALAEAWQRRHPHLQIRWDRMLDTLPDEPAWILGADNAFFDAALAALAKQGVRLEDGHLTLAGRQWTLADTALVLVGGDRPQRGLILAEDPQMVAALARKVPHYGKYGYLLFQGEKVHNRLKGQWMQTSDALSWTDPQADALPPWRLRPAAPLRPKGSTTPR